tara:strand:+ start:94 stop:1164 length:1071 start_codon:yes stop_codon:yes gene_type:complete
MAKNPQHYMGLDGFKWFVGVVEDNNDPDKLGRVKVRAYGFHTKDLTDIPTDSLPWASVMSPTNDTSMQGIGKFSKIVNGTWVVGFYMDAAEMQNPIVMGTLKGKPSYKDSRFGFSDPNDVYPEQKNSNSGHGTDKDDNDFTTETQFIESDVNRLAKNETDLSHTVLTTKEEGRSKTIPIANSDETFDEPASTYAAVYPDNNVIETSSGHIVEYDDSVGTERIHEYHRKGTFYEIDAMGNKVTRIVGDNYQIVAGKEFVNVKGDVNLTIDSNCNTYVKGNWNIQVDGNVTENIKGTYDQNVTGNATMDAATINLNSGTKGAARLDDQVDTGDDPAGISGSDGSNKIESASTTVIIGD